MNAHRRRALRRYLSEEVGSNMAREIFDEIDKLREVANAAINAGGLRLVDGDVTAPSGILVGSAALRRHMLEEQLEEQE